MLKNSLITLGLLGTYLGSIFTLSELGLDASVTIVLASILLGAFLHLLSNQASYLAVSIVITVFVFSVKDYASIPIMLSSILFGHIATHYFKTRRQRQQRAQRRPLNENREFLN